MEMKKRKNNLIHQLGTFFFPGLNLRSSTPSSENDSLNITMSLSVLRETLLVVSEYPAVKVRN